jgi:hypothetical protein
MTKYHPPTTLSLPFDKYKNARTGYVRSFGTHLATEWSYEVCSEERELIIVKVMTRDGPVQVALNQAEATEIVQTLQLFLKDWPAGQAKSGGVGV